MAADKLCVGIEKSINEKFKNEDVLKKEEDEAYHSKKEMDAIHAKMEKISASYKRGELVTKTDLKNEINKLVTKTDLEATKSNLENKTAQLETKLAWKVVWIVGGATIIILTVFSIFANLIIKLL